MQRCRAEDTALCAIRRGPSWVALTGFCGLRGIYKPPFIFYTYDTKSIKSSNPRASSKQLLQIEHTAPASSSILKGFALKMTLKTCATPLRLRGPTPLPPPPGKTLQRSLFFQLHFLMLLFGAKVVLLEYSEHFWCLEGSKIGVKMAPKSMLFFETLRNVI